MSRLSSRPSWFLIAIAALSMSLYLGLALRHNQVVGQDQTLTNARIAPQTIKSDSTAVTRTPEELKSDPQLVHANSLSRSFRAAAHVAMPSVVTIHSHQTAKKVKSTRGDNPFQGNPQFHGENPFKGTPFEGLLPQLPEGMQDFSWQMPPREGMGSGVIIDRTGMVLTNNHVVEGADKVTVHLADGREFTATDIKTDPHSDLAVLRIKADGDLPVAHLGNSDELEIGDWVIAIGNPFEQEHTVTAGIISGKGREIGSVRRTKFLQTDAAINPGNSGGPLVNLAGEVVGINTAIASNSGGYQGVGFAIPVNQARWVTEQLVKDGTVSRGYLGVGIGEVSSELAAKFGVAKGEGALVSEVFPNTPAADAKLQDGDIILKFSGRDIHSPRDVQDLVERAPLGSAQPMEVLRDGQRTMLHVTVKAMPEKYGFGERPSAPQFEKAPPSKIYGAAELGIDVSDMTSEEAEANKGYEGVVIRKIDGDSPAAPVGLRPGMLIRKVGKTAVHNVQEFEAAMKNESLKNGVLLQIRTPAGNRFVVVQAK